MARPEDNDDDEEEEGLAQGRKSVHRTAGLWTEGVLMYGGNVVSEQHTFQRLREDATGGLNKPLTTTASEGWARIILHGKS